MILVIKYEIEYLCFHDGIKEQCSTILNNEVKSQMLVVGALLHVFI